MQTQTIVSTKYQVVIPRAIRKKIQIKPGQKMNVNMSGNQIILSSSIARTKLEWPKDHLKKLKDPWKNTDRKQYLNEERNSWK